MRDEFVLCVRRALIDDGMEPAAVRAFERRLRTEFGGRKVFVPENPPTDAPERSRRASTDEGGASRPR